MDSIIEKFYNVGGQNEPNKFTQFGAFQTNNSLKLAGISHASKSPLPVRPMLNTINSSIHNTNNKPTNITINTNFTHIPTQKDFLRPQNLSFNSSSDLLYNNPVKTHKRYNSEYNILQNNVYAETKKQQHKNTNDGRKNEKFRIKKSKIRSN